MGPDIALAASARDWPDRLHRFVLDHGGGRIVDRVMSPEQATNRSFDVLLIDDVCSFLTPHLVLKIKRAGAEVIGVFSPEDGSDAKRRLLECGISDVIETEATPEEFLQEIGLSLSHRTALPPEPTVRSTVSVAVTGPCEGVGMTEVAIALAHTLAIDVPTVLVDMDSNWPSVAQRLDLPVHPNLRTALDRALHTPDRLEESLHRCGPLAVVGGRADGGRGAVVSRHESNALLDGLGAMFQVVVADLGPLLSIDGGLLREFDTVIVVGSSDPIGVGRLIRTADAILGATPGQSVLLIANQTGRGVFQSSEIRAEVSTALPGLPVSTLPHDKSIAAAAWDGRMVKGSRFRKEVRSMADVVERSVE